MRPKSLLKVVVQRMIISCCLKIGTTILTFATKFNLKYRVGTISAFAEGQSVRVRFVTTPINKKD